jgi:hypothetical protein
MRSMKNAYKILTIKYAGKENSPRRACEDNITKDAQEI